MKNRNDENESIEPTGKKFQRTIGANPLGVGLWSRSLIRRWKWQVLYETKIQCEKKIKENAVRLVWFSVLWA